jgi:hypothetical protein
MLKDASFSKDRVYRYSLSRIWDESKPYVLFIGLNPSTADENINDRTIGRCIDYAERWGYGGLKMANLFAYRATQPSDLKKAKDPIGVDNDSYIKQLSSNAGTTVVAWSDDGIYLDRVKEVLKLINSAMCLNINKSGEPSHPLYQKKTLNPKPYKIHSEKSL